MNDHIFAADALGVEQRDLELAALQYAAQRAAGREGDVGVLVEVANDRQELRVVQLVFEYDLCVMLIEAFSDNSTDVNHCAAYAAVRRGVDDYENSWEMAPLQLTYSEPHAPTLQQKKANRKLLYDLAAAAAHWAMEQEVAEYAARVDK